MNPTTVQLIIQGVNALATLTPLAVETVIRIRTALAEDPAFAQGFEALLQQAETAADDTQRMIADWRAGR
ncbi:MAG: hypothetical protein M1541_04290 [Acidobacteria bacterium]|nr:hypothetical protein [Acidobacteriota bacterium]